MQQRIRQRRDRVLWLLTVHLVVPLVLGLSSGLPLASMRMNSTADIVTDDASRGISPVYIQVNSTADIVADDGQCTLREAIIAANTNAASGATPGECPAGTPGVDIITLPAGTFTQRLFTPSTGDFDITGDLILIGVGADATIIDGGCCRPSDPSLSHWDVFAENFPHWGVFAVEGARVTMVGITITYGRASFGIGGGAIFNAGNLTLRRCIVTRNTADVGGGIYNTGTLTLIDSTIADNTGAVAGGGIKNTGAVFLRRSTITGNSSLCGGGICNDHGGTVSLTDSTITGNSASWGGGITNDGSTVQLTRSMITGNTARDQGGGILNVDLGSVTLNNATVADNSPDDIGSLPWHEAARSAYEAARSAYEAARSLWSEALARSRHDR